MKLLIINQHFYPEIAPTGQLMTDLAEDLVKKGIDVTVLTGLPSYNIEGVYHSVPKKEKYKGIDIVRVFNTRFSTKYLIYRIPNWLTFYLSAVIRVIFLPKHDIVMALSTPPYIAIAGVLLKFIKGSKFIFCVQDLYPDVVRDIGLIKNSFVLKILQGISKWIYKKADIIIVLGDAMKKELIKNNVDEKKIEVIHNWADGKEIYPLDKDKNPFIKKHNLERKFIILYSGNMTIVHEFEPIKAAMERLKDKKDIIFLFIGGGTEKKGLENFVRQKDLTNIIFLPYQPREELLYSLNACDVSLVSVKKSAEGKVVPSKLYGCLAVGKPVIGICARGSEAANVIEENKCGFVEYGYDLDKKIMELYVNTDMQKKMGKNARDTFMRFYDRGIAVNKYYEVIMNL
ncbi:MAG: glycosyltransferase family 4 protein [Deltaproteobacteria bacterium]|nr:glycosyltransferase family 4 protein [Deltaproteobacteria bacterium]